MQKHHKHDARNIQVDVKALVYRGRDALRQHLRHRHRDAQDDDDFRVQRRQGGAQRIVADAPVLLALALGALTVATNATTAAIVCAAVGWICCRVTAIQSDAGGVRIACVSIVLRWSRGNRSGAGVVE